MGLFDDFLAIQNGAPTGGLLSFLPSNLFASPRFDNAAFDPATYAPSGPPPGGTGFYGQATNVPVGNYLMPQFGTAPQTAVADANAQLPANAQPTQFQIPASSSPAIPPQLQSADAGDRLLAGLGGFAAGGQHGGLIGALANGISGFATGVRNDPLALKQRQLQNAYQALVSNGVPAPLAASVVQSGSNELLKQTFEKYGKQDRYRPATADERNAAGIADAKTPMFINTSTGEPKFGPAQTNVNVSTEKTGQAALAGKSVEAYTDAQMASRDASKRLQLYDVMEKAAQGFTSGASAEARLTAKRYLKDAGLIKGEDVPDGEVLQMISRQLAIRAQPKGQGAVSDYERSLYQSALPGLTQSPEGLKLAIQISRKLEQYDVQVAQIWRDSARKHNGLPNYLEVQDQIAALGKPLNASEMAAISGQSKTNGAGPSAPAPTLRYNPTTRKMEPVK